ncbi:hypothetical protein RND71_031161 [Anisodus tanguticus]|uniref:Uncharacterized protein n=1 Tax=Anisodus tanguticus TaxID=243964 RepID=A0AAE1RAS6_9SOLA|nr:hypothetical protein RND71_031161 [Anisodus tanguticus]
MVLGGSEENLIADGPFNLMKAVPDEHKKFFANLVWIHEEDDVSVKTEEGIKRCKLIAVHAGLEKNNPVEEQIKTLKAKDTRIPKELAKTPTIIVSGHHAKLYIEGLRLVIDEGGGYEDKSVAAVVLPSMEIVRDADHLAK